jgi:transposase
MVKYCHNLNPAEYFMTIDNPLHRQYLALRMFFAEGASAEEVALQYGYSVSTVYTYIHRFKEKLANSSNDPFFKEPQLGRKKLDHGGEINELIIAYRKRNFSVPEIKSILNAQNIKVSERYISLLLFNEGFARLPRRDNLERNKVDFAELSETCRAPISESIGPGSDKFSSQMAGIMLFVPILIEFGIDKLIEDSDYPESSVINRLSSILSFLALKLSDMERYSMDDAWCMDKGMGLFAGLNVLPKTAWFSLYSSRVTRQMNLSFLGKLRQLWDEHGFFSDTINLDFTAIPYWGDDDPFENNWSGKRTKALASIQAVLAQDPDSGLLCYGDTTIRHDNESDVILEFLDFYHHSSTESSGLKYLVFDSKFTTYENLNKLNKEKLKFITIQRRSKKLEEKIKNIPKESWKNIKVMRANGKGRNVTVCEDFTTLPGYEGNIRQVFIASKGKIKPAIMITNDFDIKLDILVRKYSQRWLVEKNISEQIHFFHLNRNSSGIVIKVDFDLVMTILAHNLYRLFAQDLDGYSHCESKTLFNKFISNAGEISITHKDVFVSLKKKRTLPLVLEQFTGNDPVICQWLHNKTIHITGATTS